MRALVPLLVVEVLVQLARPWLLHEWVWVGVGGALFLSAAWWVTRPPGKPPLRFDELGLLLFVAYLAHQFEEHGVDCLGRPYAFLLAANQTLGPALGCASTLGCPLTEDAVFYVNTLLVWWPLALASVPGQRAPVLVAMAAGVPAANAVSHLGPALLGHGYNPGLASGVVLFVPVVAFVWKQLLRAGMPKRALALGLAWGAVGHGVLLVTSLAIFVHGVAPGPVYGLVMLAYGSLPLLVARHFNVSVGQAEPDGGFTRGPAGPSAST